MLICAFARSDPGRVREQNEDSHHPGMTLFAVADGLGGHSAARAQPPWRRPRPSW